MESYLAGCYWLASYLVATIGLLVLILATLALILYVIESLLKSLKLYKLFIRFALQHTKGRKRERRQ